MSHSHPTLSMNERGCSGTLAFCVHTALAVARLPEEHSVSPQLLITTPTIDFHLPGSASVTCLVAPQPVLK